MVPFKHIHKISKTVIYTFQENYFSSSSKVALPRLNHLTIHGKSKHITTVKGSLIILQS